MGVFYEVAQGEGCTYHVVGDNAKVECPYANQSGAVCRQIDTKAHNLPTFTVANFTADDQMNAWRFGNDTVTCMRCLHDTGDPSQDIRDSGCELACGYVCRGHLIDGTNICTPPALFWEDVWLFGTVRVRGSLSTAWVSLSAAAHVAP